MTIRYPLVLNGNTIQELQSSDDLFGIPEVYNSANSAYGQANTATTIGSGAFGQANTARTHANAAFTTANAAFAGFLVGCCFQFGSGEPGPTGSEGL